MIRTILIIALSVAAVPLHGSDRKLSAEKIPDVGLRANGRVIVQGDSGSVRAYEMDGNLKKQLVRIKSTRRTFAPRPFGPEIYDSDAPLPSRVPAELRDVIQEASTTHGLDPRLVTAIAYRESAFDPNIVSHAGACGIMQLMPKTAEILGVTEIFDVRQNVFGGTQYLKMLLDSFSGDLDLALAAYNAGPGAVERYRGVPPYRETIEYIRRVRSDYERSLGRQPRG